MKTVITTLFAFLFSCSLACADSPAKLVREGNQAYQNEHYGKAIEMYEQAKQAEKDDSGHISFNKGNCLFRQGKIDEAIEQYRNASNQSENDQLSSAAQFNLGNCFYNKALESEQENPKQAVEDYQQSARCYRKALDLNKSDKEAAENISLSRRKIKQLKEILKQQQQQQQGQDNKDNKDNKDDQQQDQQSGQGQNQDGQQNQQQQNQDQQDQQNQQQSGQDQQDDQQQGQQQQQDQQNQEGQDQQQAEEQQGDQQQQQAQQGDQEQEGEPKQEIKKKVELDPRAAKIIEDEKKRREQILQVIKAQQKPVEKDW